MKRPLREFQRSDAAFDAALRPKPQPTTSPADQLASAARVLELLIKPGFSLTRTGYRWYTKYFDSFIDAHGQPQLNWREVDSDRSLLALLERLGAK